MAHQIAVVLAGCGRGDGSEIHESVSCLIHLDRCALPYQCFAPDRPQHDVINHLTGKPATETRNLLVEAARIARGNIKPLSELNPAHFDAIVFPGGFGAAKNLCTFALHGLDMQVAPDVAPILRAFHAARKPIALCCIAPVLAARVLGTNSGGPGCRVTLGAPGPAADAVAAWGSRHEPQPLRGVCVDAAQRVITTPAYMDDDATPHGVFAGIGAMIDALAGMLGAQPDVRSATLQVR